MNGLVSSGHPLVSEAAALILREGGNAFDAVVAAGFASTVAEPLLNSPGGGGFILAHTARGEEVLFDFFADVPGLGGGTMDPATLDFPSIVVTFLGAEQVFHIGMASAAVPGTLKGLLHVHRRLGRMPLADVLAPAVDLAREGVTINSFQAHLSELLEPILRSSPEALGYYTDGGGELLGTGQRYRNPELATFLEGLPADPEGFYGGDLAHQVARAMQERGGLLTREDLERYRVIERTPLEVRYRGRRMLTNPVPSLGGPLMALALSLQESVALPSDGWGTPRHLRTLGAVLTQVEGIRARGGPLPVVGDTVHDEASEVVRVSTGGTTHINVADGEGNVAGFSASNGEGCGYFVPGTGVMLNNMMGEDDLHPDGFHRSAPGSRISSMMAPSMVVENGQVVVALGTGGSKRIRTALQQVITNLVDFRLPAVEAVARPRLHLTQGTFHVEPGYPREAVDALSPFGKIVDWEAKNLYFGGVHTILPASATGAGDDRRSGHFIRLA
jgi:gamma-glutamyltranspeptidase/glutathione hydrolase